MKLSAPPPPPEPNEPDPIAIPATPAGDAPAGAAPAPITAEKPASWPAWFSAADFTLAALAVMLAFLVGSFVARNPDLWLHLATGKRLAAGEYTPGTDPFSYAAADRPWVNHSWLFDAVLYQAYGGKGVLLVLLKALAVAAAVGLVIAIRRPGFALWPWAAVAAVAAIAAAPRLALSPIVGSFLLLAVTLYLLFRMPHRPGSWRFPVAIGVIFWVWANVDAWFIIGPIALALVLVSEFLQQKLWPEPGNALQTDEAPATEEPLGRLPDVPTLAKALGIGILACMLNPHHVRVWELPFELIGVDGSLQGDSRLTLALVSPYDKFYLDNSGLGNSVNGLAYAVLLAGGGLALGLGAGQVRVSHVALWLGFAALSLGTIYAIPFFALVAVPLIAAQLNALSARVGLKTWGDPRTRFVLLGSAGGRVLCLIAVAVGCVLAWPGWLHPEVNNLAFARRVGWGIEPDPSMVKTAEQIQAWRTGDKKLPPEARGFIASAELANYIAWYAPAEKVFVNTRYNHHRRELSTYLKVRRELALAQRDEAPNPKSLDEELKRLGVEYVVLHSGPGDQSRTRILTEFAAIRMWWDADRWSPWYIDGRSSAFGWRAAGEPAKPSFAAMKIDPVALAFGPGAERLQPTSVRPLPQASGWESEFFRGVNLPPAGADEALGWKQYKSVLQEREQTYDQMSLAWGMFIPDPGGFSPHRFAGTTIASLGGVRRLGAREAGSLPRPIANESMAVPFLSIRSARRAIAAAPDHPDGYNALAIALADPDLPLTDAERVIAQITACRQCLFRMPPPDQYRRFVYFTSPTDVAVRLAQLYTGNRLEGGQFLGFPVNLPAFQVVIDSPAVGYVVERGGRVGRVGKEELSQLPRTARVEGKPYLLPLDLAREALDLAEKYAAIELGDDDGDKRSRDYIKAFGEAVQARLTEANNKYEVAKLRLGGQKVAEQVMTALRFNLVGKALRIVTDQDTNLEKEFGRDVLRVNSLRVGLELAVGRLEDAAADLEILPGQFDEAAAKPEARKALQEEDLRPLLNLMVYQKLVFEGNYAEAGSVLEKIFGPMIGRSTNIPLPADMLPYKFWPTGPVSVELASVVGFRFWSVDRVETYHETRRGIVAAQQQESEFFFRRGMLSLYEGDIANAKKRFAAAPMPAIPAWDVPARTNATAETYLRLIERANPAVPK